jgi:hypothetical protein
LSKAGITTLSNITAPNKNSPQKFKVILCTTVSITVAQATLRRPNCRKWKTKESSFPEGG